MANLDTDEFLRYLQEIVDRAERLQVQGGMPKAAEERQLLELDAMLDHARKALAAFEGWRRRELEEQRATAWLEAMNVGHTALLEAINANAVATNELLRLSQERLAEIEETVIMKGRGAFSASEDVLEEGEYLYRVLATGAQGTEAGGKLLKDAPKVPIAPAVDVLGDAINKKGA